jgi:hypothetical protein
MHRILATTALVALLAAPLSAQLDLQQPIAGPDPTSVTVGGAGTIHRLRLSEVMETTVYMPLDGPAGQIAQGAVTGPGDDWAEIGQVQEIVASPEGMIVEMVVDAGGFLGGAVANVGISINEISFVSVVDGEEDAFLIVYTGTRERLEVAPEWTWEGSQPDAGTMGTAEIEGPIVSGEETGLTDEPQTPEQPVTQIGPDGVPQGGTNLTEASPEVEYTEDQEIGTLDPAGVAALSADALVGMEVRGVTDDSIGVINDLVLDAAGGVAAVVVDVGGFLGIGAHRVALPFEQVEFVRWGITEGVVARVPYGEADLQAMPEHQG